MTSPIVFIGDSITDAGRRNDPARPLGGGYVQLVAEHFESVADERAVINRGISGDRAVDLEARWVEDALRLKPSLLTIYVGINDVWRRYDSADATTVENFEASYRRLLESTVASGVERIILLEPFVTPVNDDQLAWHEDLDPKRSVIARLALEFAAGFIPLHTILTEAAATHGAPAIADDGVHPTAFGHQLIAEAWMAEESRAATKSSRTG